MTPLEVYDRYMREWSDIGLFLPLLKNMAHGRVLEIGVREGISTSALLLGVAHRGGHVWSVDKVADPDIYKDHPNWTFMRGDSARDSEEFLQEMGRSSDDFVIDLLLIDGDHTYAGCMADLTTYGPYAKVIAVHDTHSSFSGVWEATIAYFRSRHSGEFSRAEFFTSSYGMGVLTR